MKNRICIFCFCILLNTSCTPDSSNDDIKTFWKSFVKIVKSENFKKLKEVSLPKIRCRECLENSEDEIASRNNERITDPEKWNGTYEDELMYIPIDTFIRADFKVVFDSTVRARWKKNSNVAFVFRDFEEHREEEYLSNYLEEGGKYKLHEIIISTEDPSTQSPGRSKIFQILETEQGFKFYGYISTP